MSDDLTTLQKRNFVVVNVAHKIAAIMQLEVNRLAPDAEIMYEIAVRPTEYARLVIARTTHGTRKQTSLMFNIQLVMDMAGGADDHVRAATRKKIKEIL